MLKFFIVIIVFLVALSLFLAMSVGVAFCLVWLFPAISFEIGVLIGTISLGMSFYAFVGIASALTDLYSPPIDKDILDKINDEIDLEHIVLPRSTRTRRKRR
ncbi:MAG: hypothetical protein WCS87_15600 [Methylococcaceae bacterium]